ncbi:hypothetical protein ACFLVS_00105 [Chloroflexota bacterium]
MSIGLFRDLVICIAGLVAAGVLIFIAVLLYRLYHRTSAIMDSMRVTSKTVQGITSYVGDEVVKPVIQAVALAHGIKQGIDTASKFFQKKGKGGKEDV